MMKTPPDRSEFAEYYLTYVSKVPAGEICEILAAQSTEFVALLRSISDEQSRAIVTRPRQVDDSPGREPHQRHRARVRFSGILVCARFR